MTKLDTQIVTAETEFNSSLTTYNTFVNTTETLANNVTKFKTLIQDRYDEKTYCLYCFFFCMIFGVCSAPHDEVLVFLKKVEMF